MRLEGKAAVVTGSSRGIGKVVSKQIAHYCAAKAAADMLTRGMAVELAPYNIRVNAIAPGLIETEMSKEHVLTSRELREAYCRLIPEGMPGSPEDVARAASFLASDEASYITGHVLTVDGGWSGAFYDPGFERK